MYSPKILYNSLLVADVFYISGKALKVLFVADFFRRTLEHLELHIMTQPIYNTFIVARYHES